jgi:glycosyltransferase involved in cell wall biosynthesis
MRVGIDAHMVGGQETGNETYVRGLVDGFKACAEKLEVLIYNAGRPWTEPSSNQQFQRLLTANPYVRLGLELPLRSLAQRLDILHMTYSAPVWSAAPIVLTVHDICYATNPEWFSERDLSVLSSNIPRSIHAAAYVITDSQSARDQIVEYYKVPDSKISVIPIGPGPAAAPISPEDARAELAKLGIEAKRPYLLAVGNLQPRKNLVRLLDAFKDLVGPRGHDVDLVIVGPPRFRAEDTFAASTAVTERVRFTGYVTDHQLAAFYKCSTAFVFPSLYEGFGLPALEAMSHGVPVVCSNAGSLPEVCGDAALLFDPMSVDAIIEAVDRVLSDADLRKRLGAAGSARAREFSWTKSAEMTVAVYEKARFA